MENGAATFNGMSSLNEYWKRASETDRSEIKTSSSDDSTDESTSIIKEYQDASCYVDFDEELNEIVDENEPNTVDKNLTSDKKSSKSKVEKKIKLQSSRYVRWDVLMSLGLALWAVLCIVDVLHTEEFFTRGWPVEFIVRETKNITKTVLIETPESQNSLLLHFWPHLCRISSIFSSGAPYILTILVLIVFCGELRLRKTGRHLIKKNLNTETVTAEHVKKLRVEDKKTPSVRKKPSSSRKKLSNPRIVRKMIQKNIPVKLAPSTAIHLHARILSCVEQHFPDTNTLQTRNIVVQRKIENISTTLQSGNGHLISEYKKSFTDNRRLFGHFPMTNCSVFTFVNNKKKVRHYIAKASASIHLMDASTSTYSIEKVHFEIEEYLRKTRKSSKSFSSLRTRIIDARRNSTELSTIGETRARIITSSPAFKIFLQRLNHNRCVS